MSKPADVGSLRVGGYVIVDDKPCRVASLTKSKPGKHGAAKARVVAIGVFDGAKKTFVKPVNAQIEVPMIEKRTGQVIALLESSVQLMDLENYEVSETAYPDNVELKQKLGSGVEVEYWRILGRTKIMRTKG
ncbi:MAG: translation initiation factor IF-5A [Candidatus Bathyarchaeota archaeon]|jgi:translation initiation factor 5A|nr:MAG: translation initiation factor IF-5A [Candidatus Bathyarchaeota archaeon]